MKKQIKYFHFISKYRGERYFAIVYLDVYPIYAIQVCLNPGEEKRGRAHNFGISRMSYISIMSNYAFDVNFKSVSKSKFMRAMKFVYNRFKNFDTSLLKLGSKNKTVNLIKDFNKKFNKKY